MKIDQTTLAGLATRSLYYLNKQIDAGVDIDGKPYQYSTKPFARPRGGIPFKQSLKSLVKSGRLTEFKRGGKHWVVFLGGYKDFRSITGRNPDGDFLEFTGKLRQSIIAKPNSDGRSIKIGFSSAKQATLAYYFNFSGVGKSRKLWKFLGLTEENKTLLLNDAKNQLKDDLIILAQIKELVIK
jgi:hypothetical protein